MLQNILTYLGILGVPSVFSIFVFLFRKLKAEEEKRKSEDALVKAALQALLRAQMVNDYNKWSERGYAPIYARENFENCWKQYHGLGANGVMDDIHTKFMALSTEAPK